MIIIIPFAILLVFVLSFSAIADGRFIRILCCMGVISTAVGIGAAILFFFGPRALFYSNTLFDPWDLMMIGIPSLAYGITTLAAIFSKYLWSYKKD